MGAASSDWTGGGGDCDVAGVEPNGESGVLARLAGTLVGVVAGLVVVVWLKTGTTGGDATGECRGSARAVGAEGPASSAMAAVVWIGLADGVGIATFRTAARLQRAEMRQGKAKIPLSFAQAAANSLARIFPMLMR
ncbi:hypothetical protein V6N11_031691 [Hibiscus sabdariffa]|uniref:Uncharacterized protein n=1 Tax=Hibiscus sabdariffa TaxID=183260 RepID=A0ABR2SZ70_9ROSI